MPATFFVKESKNCVDGKCPVPMSNQFYEFMDRKIAELIKKEVGLSPSGRTAMSVLASFWDKTPFYQVFPDFYCLNPKLSVYDFHHDFRFPHLKK